MDNNPDRILDNLSFELTHFLMDGNDIVNGYYTATRQRVDAIGGLEIRIYPNDHGFPHFHLKTKNPYINCKMKISDFSIIEGDMPSKHYKKLKRWYDTKLRTNDLNQTGKERLEEIWSLYQQG